MKKKILITALATAMTLTMSMTVLAGQWQLNDTGWWYDNGSGTWSTNTWQWIDDGTGVAKSYYFNADGYCLLGTTTPDGYTVDPSGAWTVNGVVQTKQVGTIDTSNNTGNSEIREDLRTSDRYTTSSGCVERFNVRTNENQLWSEAILFNPNAMSGTCSAEFRTDGKFTVLTFTAAPAKGFVDSAEGIFEVYGDDDTLLYESDSLNYETTAFSETVDIAGQQNIKLVWTLQDDNSFTWDTKGLYIKNAYIQ